MSEQLSSAASEIAHAVNVKASVVIANSSIASGVLVTSTAPELVSDSTKIGYQLATTGILYLSWLELFQIIGATYLVYNFSISVYDRFLSKLRSKKDGQQTGQ